MWYNPTKVTCLRAISVCMLAAFLAACGQQIEQYEQFYQTAKTPTKAQLSIDLPPILYKAVGKSPESGEIVKWKMRGYANDSFSHNSQCGDTLVNRFPPAGDFWLDCPGIYTIERLLNVTQLYNFLADIVYETTINITNGLNPDEETHNRTYTGSSGTGTYTANVYYEKFDQFNGVDDCVDIDQLSASFYRVTVGSSYTVRWCIYSDGSVTGYYYAAGYASFNFTSNDSATVKSIFIEANNAFGEDFSELPRPDNEFRPVTKVGVRETDGESSFRRDHGPWTMKINYENSQWIIQYGQELQLYLPCPWNEGTTEYQADCSDSGYEDQYQAPKTSVMMVSMVADDPTSQYTLDSTQNSSDGVAVMNVIAADSDNSQLDDDAKNANNIWEYRDQLYNQYGLSLPSKKQNNPIYIYEENNIQTGGEDTDLPTAISPDLVKQLDTTDWISASPTTITTPQF